MSFFPLYILILGFTIIIDYVAGICIEKSKRQRDKKILLIASLVANIGVLAYFKYFNFLNQNLERLLSYSSLHSPLPYLNILLPIGLSFHTFQAMSYTIEVYRGKQSAEKHLGIYALYVMFYPQLVAGPIERPQNILWQFHSARDYSFANLKSGLMQMAFGLFKKLVIADRISEIADKAYADPSSQNGKTFFVVALLYSFQIYCDFSGYSDIGIGAARTMGYKLVDNFNAPYLSRSFSEFWSKWHMSLSTWFRDYLYIPLGGNRVSNARRYINLMIVFLISGFWHGANWTFLIWGAVHGTLLILEDVTKRVFGNAGRGFAEVFFWRAVRTIVVFLSVSLAWIFFRAPNLQVAMTVLKKIWSASVLQPFNFALANSATLFFITVLLICLLLKEYYLSVIPTRNNWVFLLVCSSLLIFCYLFGVFNQHQFIYFQF